MMFTCAPAFRPYSAEDVLACTLNSLIASSDGSTLYRFVLMSLLSTPSSRKLLASSRAPFTLTESPWLELKEPSAGGCTPGANRANDKKLRALRGNSTTLAPSRTCPRVEVSD